MSKKKIKWLFETAFVYCVISFFRIIPFSLRTKILGSLCSFLCKIAPQAKERVLENLRHAFPQASPEWQRQIMYKNFYNLGETLSEYIQMPFDSSFYERWLIQKPNRESHRKAFSAPAILILGHLGNIEFMSGAISYANGKKIKNYGLAKRQRNPWLNRRIEKLRNSQNAFSVYTDESPRKVFKVLKEGHLIAFLADQDAGKRGSFYPFLGRLASTYEGPAFFARLTKYPIYFVWAYRNEQGQLVFEFKELSRPQIDPRDTKEWDREFTYSWVKLLEEKIRLYPSDYYFLHKRWRHQPEDPRAVWDFWHDWESKKGHSLSLPSRRL